VKFSIGNISKTPGEQLTLEQFANGDFVSACGTLIYDNMVGNPAALAFSRDYDGSLEPRQKALGHYAVILRKGGATEIVLDGFGGFHVFYDAPRGSRGPRSSRLRRLSIA
jgi:hypothetical protein